MQQIISDALCKKIISYGLHWDREYQTVMRILE